MTWSPVLKKLITLATVSREYAAVGSRLRVEFTIDAVRHKVEATVVRTPFFNPPRKVAVPPSGLTVNLARRAPSRHRVIILCLIGVFNAYLKEGFMAQAQPQTYANHGRSVAAFHFVALPILAVNFLWSAYRAVTGLSFETALAALVALALIIVALCARLFALWAQDRVIRFEMRLKLAELLPDDLKARISDLTTSQLVALRFASDAELPALVRQTLAGSLADQKAIKQAVKDWQADYQRV